MRITYDGAPAGTGATYAWPGNGHVGVGRMTISDSRPSELIRLRLEFMNLDKMVGGQFEEGLARMRSATEAAPKS